MRVLALDPGERVGWARADVAEDGSWADLRHGITGLRDMALAVHKSLVDGVTLTDFKAGQGDYDIVVVEDWRLRADIAKSMSGNSFPSVQFIGMVKLCCWLSGTKYVTQQPSIKRVADKAMRNLDPKLYELVTRPLAHDSAHDLDALRHLWYFTFKSTDLGAKHETEPQAA